MVQVISNSMHIIVVDVVVEGVNEGGEVVFGAEGVLDLVGVDAELGHLCILARNMVPWHSLQRVYYAYE